MNDFETNGQGRVQDFGVFGFCWFGVWGLGFDRLGLGFGVQDSGLLGFGVLGFGFGV